MVAGTTTAAADARITPGAAVTTDLTGHPAASGIGSLMAYWRFYRAVATAQLAAWLASSGLGDGGLLVDISGPHLPCAAQAAAAGLTVVRIRPTAPVRAGGRVGGRPAKNGRLSDGRGRDARGRDGRGRGARAKDGPAGHGSITTVVADAAALPFLDDRSVDGVIADDRTLSRHLFAEQALTEIARVLRPGGALFACFDSLVLGMAIKAEQHHWAELTDLRSADVVLVPWPDGAITRCFGGDQLRELFAEARLEITWIRPRTVLSPTAVEHILKRRPAALSNLVCAELAADPDDSVGIHLIVNARKHRRT
jgi:SAM-dependent methyltransferase